MNKRAIDIYNEINIEKAKVRGNWIHLTYDDGTYEWRSKPINFSKMFSEDGKWSHYGQLEIGKFIKDIKNDRNRKSIAIENVYAYNNKVVVVKFKDGTKIRSIFDGDGEFSVYNGIAICIAKKLIGKDGSKVFNDTMRNVMKLYHKKEADRVDWIFKESEKMRKKGMKEKDIAKEFNMSILDLRKARSDAKKKNMVKPNTEEKEPEVPDDANTNG